MDIKEISSDNEDICVICLDQLINVKLLSCKHSCLCSVCYIELFHQNNGIILCPLCRTTNKSAYVANLEEITNIFINERGNDFFDFLKSYFRLISVPDKIDGVLDTIHDNYITLDSKGPCLSIEQVEILLKLVIDKGFFISKNSNRLRNLLVALCREPWNIDVNLGTHGVCYYGNLGEIPSVNKAIILLHGNHRSLINRTMLP